MVQIIVLAAVAFFLFWRLKSVLGSRQGFEKTKDSISKEDKTSNHNKKKNSDNKVIVLTSENEEITSGLRLT